MKVLVIEDEKDLSESICLYLKQEDFLCEQAFDYHSAIEMVGLNEYDCIILDITLPYGNGLDVLKEIQRENKSDGVIIISARNSQNDKINGLQLGADDYLAKPFHMAELSARVNAIIRRRLFNGHNQAVIGNLVIDIQNKCIRSQERQIPLTRKEYDLLLYFVGNKNRVVTKEAIVEHLWGSEADLLDNFDFIYAHIKKLRKKLAEGGCPDYIQVHYNMGYKFSVD